MPWTEVMHKWKTGQLKSGGSGKPVKSQKQAVAIMLSEKRSKNPEYAAPKPKNLSQRIRTPQAQAEMKRFKTEAHNADFRRPKKPVVSRYRNA